MRSTLPSSMESAVVSGLRAAEHVLAERGHPRDLVAPLPPRGRVAQLLAGAARSRRQALLDRALSA
jgi:hypothetical protein